MTQHAPVGFLCVSPLRARELWAAALPMLTEAYAAADAEVPDDLLAEIEDRRALLWLAVVDGEIAATLITRLLKTPAGLVCSVGPGAGEQLERYKAFGFALIENYAREEGCCMVRISDTRKGWLRALPGFHLASVTIEKRLP